MTFLAWQSSDCCDELSSSQQSGENQKRRKRETNESVWNTIGLIAAAMEPMMFWAFTPGTTPVRLGGLMERVVMIEIEIWYIVLGWRIFVPTGLHQAAI